MSTNDDSYFAKAKIEIAGETTLSNAWTKLSTFDVDYTDSRGDPHRLKREIYHRTPAACILLYDPKRNTIVFVRQFRLAAHLTGFPAWVIEVPAGLLDGDDPEEAIRREAIEETGFRVRETRFLFKALTAPGSVTEVVHFFVALIDSTDRVAEGGGLADEHEDLEVMEVALDEAATMIETGEIHDVKTILLVQWAMLNRSRLG
jgi:ADP-ribose pyrophosphatase